MNIKKFYLVATLVIFSCISGVSGPNNNELLIMTLNIRFDNPGDGINAWIHRIPLVEDYMGKMKPDIVGMQENLFHQNEDLLRVMPGYAYIGKGRDDGEKGGEFSPVFYRTDRFTLLETGQFWLSETPDIPGSIGWEAILPRVVSWALLNDKESNTSLYVFNTHYSHVSDLARRKSMEFMSEQIKKIAGDNKVIVTGDFNITKGSELYYDMLAHLYKNNRLHNVELIAENPVVDAKSSFNAFRHGTSSRVIDYIFVDHHFEVIEYAIDRVKDGDVFISDHWPVWARIRIK
jgi:endonuclease/exonuclease/phosphatase family metal-dependent hydrolase